MKDLVKKEFQHLAFSPRFYDKPPFYYSKSYAKQYGCDLTILNGPGIGDVVCFSRLVEDYGRKKGRPLKLLTAPLTLHYGLHECETLHPIWESNPFISKCVNADKIDPSIMEKVIIEKDNMFQHRHVLHNIGFNYGVPPSVLRPALYLRHDEQEWALKTLCGLKHPLVCLLPCGVSSSPEQSTWHKEQWSLLISELKNEVGFFQIGRSDYQFKDLPAAHFNTSIRQAMALIWACDIFVGFDSGMTHVATAFERPSIVIWDAAYKTPIEEAKAPGFALATLSRWSYPQNENILLVGNKDVEIRTHIRNYIKARIDLLK